MESEKPAFTPWRAAKVSGGSYFDVFDSRDYDVVTVYGADAEAKAHLIAAAPDMFEALTTMLNLYVNLVNSGDAGFWNPEEEGEVKIARAALSKALGKDAP